MRNDDGFTLLEALFAMAIFAVAMLGVIGMQINAIQADEETRRKDMAVQLLTAGAEIIECSSYTSQVLYPTSGSNSMAESHFSNFITKVGENNENNPWMTWGEGRARMFMRYNQAFKDIDSNGAQGANEPQFKKVLLVSSWKSLKTGDTKTMHRVVVKPENMLQ